MIILDEDQLAAVRELKELRAAVAQFGKRIDEIRDMILTVLDGAEVGVDGFGAPAVHVDTQIRETIDKDRLKAMFPEIYDEVVAQKPSTILKVDLDA